MDSEVIRLCGRFSQYWPLSQWQEIWPFDSGTFNYEPRYNVAPGTPMLVLECHATRLEGRLVFWGIKTPQAFLINARVETVRTRPTFRSLLSTGRMVIPMNGYFEWDRLTHQPYYIYDVKDRPIFALGLYGADGSVILTRPACDTLAAIHSRMPVLAPRDLAQEWLFRGHIANLVNAIVTTVPPLTVHAVGRRVNKSTNQGADLIEPPRTSTLPSEW